MLSGQPWASWQEVAGAQLCVCGGLAAIPKRGAVTKPRYKQENNYQKFGALGGRRREPVRRGKNAENSLKEVLLRREPLASAHLAARVAALNGGFLFFFFG